jgi:hypothetical protein
MKQDDFNDDADLEIPEITDFTGGETGKYYDAYQAWKKRQVVLDPDVASEFPDAVSVNETLRRVARARRRRRAKVSTS